MTNNNNNPNLIGICSPFTSTYDTTTIYAGRGEEGRGGGGGESGERRREKDVSGGGEDKSGEI